MSGLVAVISRLPGDPVSSEESAGLERAYEAMRGHKVKEVLQAGNAARVALFGRPDGDDAAVVERRQGSWAVAVGVVHSEGPLLDSRLERLDGAFALVRHDQDLGAITAASDPFGMQHFYVAETPGRVYLSTSAIVLARFLHASPSALDVFTYLRIGRNLGANTHWPAVERVLPATRLSILNGKVERSRYWRPALDDSVRRLPFNRAVEHCTEVAVETVRTYLCNGTATWTWSDLTGGFDTRLLDLLLQRAGVPFHANTVGSDDHEDVVIASRVAREAGWDWTRFQLPAHWDEILPKMLPHSLGWSDGHLDILQLSEVLWHHREKSRLNPSLLIGGGGERFRDRAWQQEFLRASRSKVVENYLRMRVLPPLGVPVFRTDRSEDAREELGRQIEAWVEPYASEPNTYQLDLLAAFMTTGHYGAYRSAAAAFVDAQVPFYFKPIFTAATSTNFRFRRNHRLQRHVIAGLDRNLAAIETTDGGPAEPWRLSNLHRFAPYYGRIARKAIGKLSQKATGRPVLPSRHLNGRMAARAAVVNHLESTADFRYDELRLAPLLRRDGFEELVRGARDPAVGDATLLGRVITAELALRETDGTLQE
jgi:hypothetical protein